MSLYGGIETGGTTWKCAIGTGPDDLRAETGFPTTMPDETIDRAAAFFESGEPVAALGIGSFGPVDLRAGSPTWGHVTTTPKPGWANADVAGPLGRRLGVPVAFDTDVNAAALGEHRWGAAQGVDTFVYLTVGTGIGGGVMAAGRLVHGLAHPNSGTSASRTTVPPIRFPASAPTTATAGKGSPPGLRSRHAGASRPSSCSTSPRSGSWRRTTSPSAWSA